MGEKLTLEVSKDKLKAYIILNTTKIDEFEIFDFLKEKGIRYGIDEFEIYRICRDLPLGEKRLIAEGKAPKEPQDAKLVYHCLKKEKDKLLEYADGSVDFKNRNLFLNVKEGEVLVEKIPSKEAEDGIDVFGNPVKARKPKDVKLPYGKNTYLSDDKLKLIAQKNGYVVIKDSKVDVETTLVLENVDINVGNIYFVGDVVVKGYVESGYELIAEGNIEIRGGVEGAFVRGKEITIRGGIKGSEVECQKLYCKFIEHSKINAKEIVKVDNYILHSEVASDGVVSVEGAKAKIIGGHIIAKDWVKTKILGNYLELPTVVEVGVEPSLRKEYQILKDELQKSKQKASCLRLNILTLQKSNKEYKELEDEFFYLQDKITEFSKRLRELERQINFGIGGKVFIISKIYPGVVIRIGNKSLTIKQEYRAVYFSESLGMIITSPLR